MKLPKFNLAGIKTFFFEIFQDQDGGSSMKRTVFLFLTLVFCGLMGGVYFHATMDQATLTFLTTNLGYMKEMIIWIGGMILGEKAPDLMSAFKGKLPPEKVVVVAEKVE
jgi:hypothetical protein